MALLRLHLLVFSSPLLSLLSEARDTPYSKQMSLLTQPLWESGGKEEDIVLMVLLLPPPPTPPSFRSRRDDDLIFHRLTCPVHQLDTLRTVPNILSLLSPQPPSPCPVLPCPLLIVCKLRAAFNNPNSITVWDGQLALTAKSRATKIPPNKTTTTTFLLAWLLLFFPWLYQSHIVCAFGFRLVYFFYFYDIYFSVSVIPKNKTHTHTQTYTERRQFASEIDGNI